MSTICMIYTAASHQEAVYCSGHTFETIKSFIVIFTITFFWGLCKQNTVLWKNVSLKQGLLIYSVAASGKNSIITSENIVIQV